MNNKKIKIPSSCREPSIILRIKGIIDGKRGVDVCKSYMSKILYSTETMCLKSIAEAEIEILPLYTEAASIISKVQTIEKTNNLSCSRRNHKYRTSCIMRLREIDEQINSNDIIIQQKLNGIKAKAFSKISSYLKGTNRFLESKLVLQDALFDDNVFSRYKEMHEQSDNARKALLKSAID